MQESSNTNHWYNSKILNYRLYYARIQDSAYGQLTPIKTADYLKA